MGDRSVSSFSANPYSRSGIGAHRRRSGLLAASSVQAVRQLLAAWQINGVRWRSLFRTDKALRALAALDDDDIGKLSETGRRLRREARQQSGAAGPAGTEG